MYDVLQEFRNIDISILFFGVGYDREGMNVENKSSVNFSSLIIGVLLIIMLFMIGYIINPSIADMFRDMSIKTHGSTMWLMECHWAIYTLLGIIGAFLLVYKDLIYSQRIAIFINCYVIILFLVILLIYVSFVIMPIFDPNGFLTIE